MSYLTVQVTSRGGYPGRRPRAPCPLLMTWTTENLPLLLKTVRKISFTRTNTLVIYIYFCFLCFRLHSSPGLSEMVMESASSPGPFRNTQMSKAAQTHKLRKLRAPSKCRECDGLVVFHGAECEEVTLVSFLLNSSQRDPSNRAPRFHNITSTR